MKIERIIKEKTEKFNTPKTLEKQNHHEIYFSKSKKKYNGVERKTGQ